MKSTALAIGIGAAIWAASFMAYQGYRDRPPSAEENNIAVHLVLGNGFSSPMTFSPGAPPSAWSAPVYPFLIAAAYGILGIQSPGSTTLLMLLNAVFFGAAAAGIFAVGRLLFRANAPGLLASSLFAVHPLFLFYAGDFWDETLALAIFAWVVAASIRIGGETSPPDGETPLSPAAGLGAAMGVLALVNTCYAATYPVLLLIAFPPRPGSHRWARIGLSVALCAAVVAPWTVRNLSAFGRPVLVRTGFGIQLWLGNEPGSRGWLDAGTYRLHPCCNEEERRALLEMGEPGYDDFCFRRFGSRLAEDPVAFLERCARRSGYLVFGEPREQFPYLPATRWKGFAIWSLVLNGAVFALGLAGMAGARRLGYPAGRVAVLTFSTALPFLPTAVGDRYALPLRALLLLFAAAAAWMAVARILAGRWPSADRFTADT